MKFSDVMFSDLTEDQVRQLSDRERALWIMRPKDQVPSARVWMYVRVALIMAAFFYYRGSDEARSLIFVLGCYEFAYFNQLKDRLRLQLSIERDRYVESVRELETSSSATER